MVFVLLFNLYLLNVFVPPVTYFSTSCYDYWIYSHCVLSIRYHVLDKCVQRRRESFTLIYIFVYKDVGIIHTHLHI